MALFVSLTSFGQVPQTASTICVYNDAAFVLDWRLKNVATGAESATVSHYPVGQVKCLSVNSTVGGVAGAAVVPVVHAVLGKTESGASPVLYDPANASQVTYVCKGTTLDFSCVPGPPPPTAADVAKDMGAFLAGFATALGPELGFESCVRDINATYRAVLATVDFFESGINHKTAPSVLKAFELIGGILKDIGEAIVDCVKDAVQLAAKVKAAAAALSGNVLAIIKVVIDDFVHIWHERKEITEDCKTTSADWRAGDFEGAGRAVGNITAIIISGLKEPALVEA